MLGWVEREKSFITLGPGYTFTGVFSIDIYYIIGPIIVTSNNFAVLSSDIQAIWVFLDLTIFITKVL